MASSSSTRQEPSTSSIVANASPVSTEAKMIVAIGQDHCQQLKDVLSKEDPSTMVVVMASSNKIPTPPKPRPAVMDSRLLAVACSGSWKKLESFFNGEDHQIFGDGYMKSSAMQPAFCDEEALLPGGSFLKGVTMDGDTFLHVMATNSDGENLNEHCICPICRKSVSLLLEANKNGDTPLHCAARAGNFKMVSFLIDLARVKDYDVNTMKELLRIQNKSKWTALHEAVRSGYNDIVQLLMTHDEQLASFPKDDTSPLYLAILLENRRIAKTLYDLSRGNLSYSGPNGQNALHAAVFRGKDLTKQLLEWNDALTIQQDENGSTPLHFAASTGRYGRAIWLLLLEANPNVLYQTDNNGSFPIHVAASVGATLAISDFLEESPSCVGLRDARGRTFLHVAVEKEKMCTVRSACSNRSVSWILNMLDNDGNTAMHLAVQGGRLIMFCALLENSQVELNLTNKKGETPFDIARSNLIIKGLHSNLNNEAQIHDTLGVVGAKLGIFRLDYFEEKKEIAQARQDVTRKMKSVKEGTQSLCIGSVLISTVTFGASFAMPGGYRADDHTNGGTPTLAGRFAFDAFTIANSFAFTSAMISTIALMNSGSPIINPWIRQVHLGIAFSSMYISITCLVAAFSLGTYMMLAQVAYKTVIAVCAMSSLILVYHSLEIAIKNSLLVTPIRRRKGMCHGILWTLPLATFAFMVTILIQLWPIAVIFGLTALSHTGGKVA